MLRRILGFNIIRNKENAMYSEELSLRMNLLNAQRGFYILLLGVIIEPILIVFYDIPNIRDNGWLGQNGLYYLLLHGILLIVSIIGVVQFHSYWKTGIFLFFKKVKFEPFALSILFLFLAAVAMINGLDQFNTDSITIYAFYLILVGVMFLVRPKQIAFVLVLSHIVFVISMVLFQNDEVVMISNLTNGTIAMVCSLVIAFGFYNNFYELTVKSLMLEESANKLKVLSNTDPLTESYNRRYFYQYLKEINFDEENKRVSFLLFDIDSFKNINDVYGHLVGDEMLVIFTDVLKQHCEANELVVRWGGEEFLLMLIDRSDQELQEMINSIQKQCMEAYSKILDIHIKMTASVGITSSNKFDYTQMDHMLSNVDKALYNAKNNGKNCSSFFDYNNI